MDSIRKQIGRRIRLIRNRLGDNQTDFAARLNISDKSVSSYELGDTSPSLEVLINIVRIGHVSFDWLITGAKMVTDDGISDQEIRLLMLYRQSSGKRREMIMEIAELAAKVDELEMVESSSDNKKE